MIKIKSDKIIINETLFSGYVYISGDKIKEVSNLDKPADFFYDFTNKYVSAGFIDLHTHGAGGFDFLSTSVDDVIEGCNFQFIHGVTSVLPTVSAAEFSVMEKAVENISLAKKSGKVNGNIIGAHLEGPYLSEKQCGAQCPCFITKPIKEEYVGLVKKYKNDIARWTFAPENDEDCEFCEFLCDNGILVSIGHSDATYPQVKKAVDKGCSLVTHLYSCTSTVTRNKGFRSLGIIESAFLLDDLKVEIIADGKHLPPELINMIIKIKGTDNVALITDSLSIAGTSVKEGIMSGTEFIVEDGVCKLKDRSAFAGSVATADMLIKILVNDCNLPITTAVKMLTEVPAELLHIKKGKIEEGYDADIIVFDEDIKISQIFMGENHIVI